MKYLQTVALIAGAIIAALYLVAFAAVWTGNADWPLWLQIITTLPMIALATFLGFRLWKEVHTSRESENSRRYGL